MKLRQGRAYQRQGHTAPPHACRVSRARLPPEAVAPLLSHHDDNAHGSSFDLRPSFRSNCCNCTHEPAAKLVDACIPHTHTFINTIRLDSWIISRDSTIPLVSLCVHRDAPAIPLGSLCVQRDAHSHKTTMPLRLCDTRLPAFAVHCCCRGSTTQKLQLSHHSEAAHQNILHDCRCRCVHLSIRVHLYVNVVHFLSPVGEYS